MQWNWHIRHVGAKAVTHKSMLIGLRLSPLRRAAQAAALAAFLWLLFFVPAPSNSAPEGDSSGLRHVSGMVLEMDPLVSISASLAARTLVPALAVAGSLLAMTLVFPRFFCGYLCPLGTMIDMFDFALGKRLKRLHLPARGWWVNLRFYVLAAILACALLGVLISGFLAAIPLLTRGLALVAGTLQLASVRGHSSVGPLTWVNYLGLAQLAAVLAAGVLGRRFWCRTLCPTGAVFSLLGRLSLGRRRVNDNCTECGRCRTTCSMGAVGEDFEVHPESCTFCQECGGVCPTAAISFGPRPAKAAAAANSPAATAPAGTNLSRRALLGAAVGGVAVAAGLPRLDSLAGAAPGKAWPIRPPGSVPEAMFLAKCVRCGQCIKVCPTGFLAPLGLQLGIEGLWTPHGAADLVGCLRECNRCGQVCPTGAIRALIPAEKQAAHIGLAVVDRKLCLPHANKGECTLCQEQCKHAGYNAIEFERVHVQADEMGVPVDDTGCLAPMVLKDKCVGCGQCQARCNITNVRQKGLLAGSAILVQAGGQQEDRIADGSYIELHRPKPPAPPAQTAPASRPKDDFLPDFIR